MSDQPGSGQDPHQQPPPAGPGPAGPPPGFSGGDPLGPGSGAPQQPQPYQPPPQQPQPYQPPQQQPYSPPPGGDFAQKGGGLPPGLQGSMGSSPVHGGGFGHSGPQASWGKRALAVIIDGLILAIPIIIAITVMTALFASDDDGSSAGLFGGGFVLMLLASFLIQLAYYPVLMARKGDKNGQTLGKQAMNIRAVREDGQQIDMSSALMREIVGKVIPGSVCGLYTLIDYLFPLWDDKKQALHDKIANTRVVSTS